MFRALVLAHLAVGARALKAVVLGPGDPWLSLCAAKTMHVKRGWSVSCACNKPAEASNMLWGKETKESPVRIVDGAEEIGEALSDAENMVLNGCGFGGLNVGFAEIALRNAPKLAKVSVALEAGKSGDALAAVRKACAERDIPLNVLRFGSLRGGGPGGEGEAEDLGLNKHFYDTQFDYPKFQMDSYHDKFVLGLSAAPGDKPANMFQKAFAGNTMGRADGVSNRATAATACVAALATDVVELDLTLTSEEGQRDALITDDEAWGAFFSDGTAGSAMVSGPVD